MKKQYIILIGAAALVLIYFMVSFIRGDIFKMDNTLADVGIDSLGLVESIFAIEESFDITVPFNANNPTESEFDISSIAAIVAAVEKLKAEQAA